MSYWKILGSTRNRSTRISFFRSLPLSLTEYYHHIYSISFSIPIFVRPHLVSTCFQTGYVYKGQPKFDGAKSATCPTGPPRGAEWFKVKVTVSTGIPAEKVKVYLNGNMVTSFNPRYPIKRRGGVLVANGYKNVIYFRGFKIL